MLIYGIVIINSGFFSGDDFYIINPLSDITNLNDYIDGIIRHKIPDIQPVRDISYFIDIQLKPFLGLKIFFISNLLLWMLILLQVKKVIAHFVTNNIHASYLTILFGIYPTFVWVVSVISSRKHLLSFLFSLLMLNAHLYAKRFRGSKIITFYLLSILSNPISIFSYILLLFVGCEAGSLNRVKTHVKSFLGLTLISLIFLYLNYKYYNTYMLETKGYLTLQEFDLNNSFLAFGRFFYQLALPIYFSTFYNSNSIFDYIGIFLFFILFYFVFKKVNSKLFISIIVLYSINLIIPTIRVSHNFISDSYLLMPGLAYVLLLYYLVKDYIICRKWICVIFLLILSVKSIYEARFFTSAKELTAISFHREPSCKNMEPYLQNLLLEGKFEEINLHSGVIYNSCKASFGPPLFSTLVFVLNGDDDLKIKILGNINHLTSQILIELIKYKRHETNRLKELISNSKNLLNSGSYQHFQYFIISQIEQFCTKNKAECIL